MRTKLRSKFTLFFIVCAALLAFAGTAMALTADPSGNTAPAPTIQSDKEDYAPGSTVTLTGSGWQAGESVHINVNDDLGQTWSRDVDVAADASGNITDQFQLPSTFVAVYKVTATGAQSGVVTTTFTDGNVSLKLATDSASVPGAWSVNYLRFNASDCSGTGTPGTAAGGTNVGAGNDGFRATGVTPPAGYSFVGWSTTAGGSAGSGNPSPCIAGNPGGDLFAHFTLATRATSTSLSSSSNPSTYGNNVTFTANVTATAGSPTNQGTVTFKDGATTLCSNVALSSGQATCGPTSALSAGSHSITADYSGTPSGTPQFGASQGSLTQTVNKAPLTVTADNKSREYGDANPTFTASYSGFKNGQTLATSGVTGSPSLSTTATQSSPVGSHPITAAAGTLVSGNYSFTFQNGSLSVTKAALSVKADDKSREYGDANPTFTGTLTGVKNNDAITASYSTTATAASDVGTFAIVADVNGAAGVLDNYTVTKTNGTLTITKRAIEVTADNKTKTYGDNDPALTYTVTSGTLVNPNDLSGALSRDAGQDVGTYAITQGTLAGSGNYQITFKNGTLTITKAALSVKADDATKVYGDANPPLTGTLTGVKNNDAITASYSTTATAASDVGTFAIVADVNGAAGVLDNYTVTKTNGTLTVTKAALSVKANDESREYGDANPTFTGTLTGVKNNDDITASYSTTATQSSNVGTFAIVADVNGAAGVLDNYTVTKTNGTLTVTKAALSVKADDATKVYGDANPPLTGTLTGVKNNDAITASYSTTATAASDVGTFAIVADVNGAAGVLDNYTVTKTNGTLTITKRAIEVTADNKTKTYGDNDPALTYTVTSGTLVNPNDLSGALSRDAGQDVGTYAITQGTLAGSGNYDLTFKNGTLTIDKRAIEVTADNKTKTYGDNDPALTYTVTSGTLVNPNDLSGALSRDAGQDVGTYAITQGTLAGSGNYQITFKNGTLTITNATLTVKADDKSRVYGDANPTFTGTLTGVKNGDAITASYSTPATQTSNVGGYPITATLSDPGNKLSNYTVTNTGGTLTITKATLTVKANDATKILGAANPTFTATYSGFKNGQMLANSGVTGSPSLTTTATATSPIGSYPITAAVGTLASTNYSFTFQPGQLKIVFNYSGFLQPINDTAHQTGLFESKFRLGQTIPVKFELRDAAGNLVQQATNPTFTKSGRLGACDATTALEVVETLTPDPTTQYIYTGGQYHYNWSTKGLTAGEYRIYANLADGTINYVDICLTK